MRGYQPRSTRSQGRSISGGIVSYDLALMRRRTPPAISGLQRTTWGLRNGYAMAGIDRPRAQACDFAGWRNEAHAVTENTLERSSD
jgi:hypothetical protein